MECSGEHRGFGVNISYIRSTTLDSLNKSQLDILKISGNKRLNEFLRFYSINKNLPKKELFNSKILHYYRKMVKILTFRLKLNPRMNTIMVMFRKEERCLRLIASSLIVRKI